MYGCCHGLRYTYMIETLLLRYRQDYKTTTVVPLLFAVVSKFTAALATAAVRTDVAPCLLLLVPTPVEEGKAKHEESVVLVSGNLWRLLSPELRDFVRLCAT